MAPAHAHPTHVSPEPPCPGPIQVTQLDSETVLVLIDRKCPAGGCLCRACVPRGCEVGSHSRDGEQGVAQQGGWGGSWVVALGRVVGAGGSDPTPPRPCPHRKHQSGDTAGSPGSPSRGPRDPLRRGCGVRGWVLGWRRVPSTAPHQLCHSPASAASWGQAGPHMTSLARFGVQRGLPRAGRWGWGATALTPLPQITLVPAVLVKNCLQAFWRHGVQVRHFGSTQVRPPTPAMLTLDPTAPPP